jgi:hypothetical protein
MPTHTAVNLLPPGDAADSAGLVWAGLVWAVPVRSANDEDAGRSWSGAMDGS